MTDTIKNDVFFPPMCSPYCNHTDSDLARLNNERLEKLIQHQDKEEIRQVYNQDIFPLELERVRREAQKRIQSGCQILDLLFVTVGSQGDTPMLATVASPAKFIIYLHTEEFQSSAVEVTKTLGMGPDMASFESVGDGKDMLSIYRAVYDQWRKRGQPKRVGIDFTGGLKTMSAGAAVSGFCIPGAEIYYIESDQKRIGDIPIWVNERRVEMDNPFLVFGEIKRNTARSLLKNGKWAAAQNAYTEIAAKVKDSKPDEFRARLAEGYDALDRLDFENAKRVLSDLVVTLNALAPSMKDDAIVKKREHIRANGQGAQILHEINSMVRGAVDPTRDVTILTDHKYIDLMFYLLSMARRRLTEGLYDISALLSYRITEGILQRRLAMLSGANTSNMDWHAITQRLGRKDVQELILDYNQCIRKYIGKKVKNHYLLDPENPKKQLGRVESFLLVHMIAPEDVTDGIDPKKFSGIGNARNQSILAHGMKKIDEKIARSVFEMSEQLCQRTIGIEGIPSSEQEQLALRHEFIDID